jgi:signal transduction histidine kinase
MRLGRRLVGAVRVLPADIEGEELAFVEALAHGVAEVASRGALRAAVEDASRERAIAAERGRIAADLHDTAGQLFVAIGLLSRREAEHLPGDSPWQQKFTRLAELADTGKWEISRAIQALAFFPEARRGIAPSLRALARSYESDSGIETFVEVSGTPTRLSPRIERALYRVAHEALSNAWRHSRCNIVRICLDFETTDVRLRVLDDGVGIRRVGSLIGVGIAGMRRSLTEVGGSLRLRPIKPHGTVVEARVKKESR